MSKARVRQFSRAFPLLSHLSSAYPAEYGLYLAIDDQRGLFSDDGYAIVECSRVRAAVARGGFSFDPAVTRDRKAPRPPVMLVDRKSHKHVQL